MLLVLRCTVRGLDLAAIPGRLLCVLLLRLAVLRLGARRQVEDLAGGGGLPPEP